MENGFQTYSELKKKLNGIKPSYEELLSTVEWRSLRQKILKRDKNQCQKCYTTPTENSNGRYIRNFTQEEKAELKLLYEVKDQLREPDLVIEGIPVKFKSAVPEGEFVSNPIFLHIHHTYYILSSLPWEYDSDSLITLCESCHFDLHSSSKIPCYKDEERIIKLNLTNCPRCCGAGYLIQYKHVQNGVCFECGGAKYIELIGNYR